MPLEPTPETLEQISTLSELANTFDQAAVKLGVTPDEFGQFLAAHPDARRRWQEGGIDAMNQLRVSLTKAALAGSVQAFKALDDAHKEAAAKQAVPAPSASTASSSPEKKQAGRAWRFCVVKEAAVDCGVTEKFVQNMIKEGKAEGQAGRPNPVPMKLARGDWTVQPGAVYTWALQRIERGISSRKPPGFKEPPGFQEAKETLANVVVSHPQSQFVDALGLDFEKILRRVLDSSELPNEDKKILISAAESIRRNTDSEERRLAKIPREDVIKMLRSLGEMYCYTIESSANARAAELLKLIRDQFQVELAQKNTAAVQIIARALCDQANRIEIPALRVRVKEAVEGIELLEGVV